jgi:hypothetical protein
VQDVEGFRTDVRVAVLSYFATDWYVDQMTSQVNDSPPDFFRKRRLYSRKNDYLMYIGSGDGSKIKISTNQ